ncbi:MAG: DUF4352 domain-containing protein [Gaiellales bacterium]
MPQAKTLPTSGTVRLPDGRVYTVAAPGTPLVLDDIKVRLLSVNWVRSAGVANPPPGTSRYAVVVLSVQNLSSAAHTIPVTQFWLLDPGLHEYLPRARSSVPQPLVGKRVEPGAGVRGSLVFPTPGEFARGTLLVYRFADAAAIAHAKHVGILRLQ